MGELRERFDNAGEVVGIDVGNIKEMSCGVSDDIEVLDVWKNAGTIFSRAFAGAWVSGTAAWKAKSDTVEYSVPEDFSEASTRFR